MSLNSIVTANNTWKIQCSPNLDINDTKPSRFDNGDVQVRLFQLNTSKSSDGGGIQSKIVHEMQSELAYPLEILF